MQSDQRPEHSAHQRRRSSEDRGGRPGDAIDRCRRLVRRRIRETWPAFTAARYLAPGATGSGTREERDRLLAEAEIILGGWPFPLDLRARAPRLKWFHQRPAGASNLLKGDLWGSDVTVTTSRGRAIRWRSRNMRWPELCTSPRACIAPRSIGTRGVFDHRAYRPLLLEGKTACVVGAGGIGLEVGRLCAALGMRVVGTRRHPQPERAPAAGIQRDRRRRRSRPVPAGERYRGDLLPMDAGDDPPVRPGPLCRDEAGQHPRQCRPRRDRRRGRARRCAAARSSARRRARCLCRRIRAHAAGAALVRSQGADHAAYLGLPAIRTVMAPSTCSATICAPISTAGRCGT